MFHRLIRLLFLSALTLTTWFASAADCPDTQPKITGPDVVGASMNSVQYVTPFVAGHTYSWIITRISDGSVVGTSSTNLLNHVWNTPGDFKIDLSEGISGNPTCLSVAAPMFIAVKPMLTAYFYYEFDATHGCFYNEVTFSATGNGIYPPPSDGTISYTWSWGEYAPPAAVVWGTTGITPIVTDNSIVKINFPSISGKTYATKLVVAKTFAGVVYTDEIIDYVYVDPDKYKPVAVLAIPTTPNCLNQEFNFSAVGSLPTIMATNEAFLYVDWDFGDGTTQHYELLGTVPPPLTTTHTYSTPGNGIVVTVTLTNTINCKASKSITIDVPNTMPVAGFTFAQTCVFEPAPFTDVSTAGQNPLNITDWWWTWGDGTSDHYYIPGNPPPTPVTHVFTDLLPHNVILKVRNSNGCENTTIGTTVLAEPSPKADFTYPTVICAGDVVQFTNMSSQLTGSPIVTYAWDFGDTGSPSNLSSLPDPSHMFSGTGNYIVSLTVTNQAGCSNTKILPVTNPLVVSPHPDIDFTAVLGTTAYQQIFTSIINPAQNVGNNVYWEFGDGNSGFGSPFTHNYPGPGLYTAKCTAIDMLTGCSNIVTHPIMLGSPPAPCFTANPPNQCQNVPILFVPCPPGGVIAQEDWDFGDGNTAQYFPPNVPASPAHPYNTPGLFHVIRILNQGTPQEVQFDLWVTIFDAPTANFIWFSDPAHMHQGMACDGQDVYFADESYSNTTPPGTIYKWQWDFGDPLSGPNNTSTVQNPNHTFTPVSAGGFASYNVTLKVWENLQDCPSTVTTINVPINPPIPVEFTYNNNVCLDQTVNFATDPTVLPPASYTWFWDFGDGITSLASGGTSHLFASVGDYTVTLMLTDTNGCSKSIQHVVSIIPKPIANFSFESPTCFGKPIQFTSLSYVPLPYNDVIVAWNWDFGDGVGTANTATPSYIYPVFSATGYNVTLTVTTNRGCSESKTINVQQIPAPIAEFEVEAGTYSCMTPQAVQFNSTLSQTNGGGAILYWNWNFGDMGTSTVQNPAHVYTTAGTKTVQLVVTNSNGCSDTISHDIIINALPDVNFTTDTACEGTDMQFTDASTTPAGSTIVSYAWSFGDGGLATIASPTHNYASYGVYDVILTIVNSNGCSNTITKQVTIHPNPIAAFTFSPATCIGNPVTFTNLSFVPAGFTESIKTWTWDFDDGSTPTTITFPNNPNITYTFLGTATSHNVKLTVTTFNGCTAFIVKTVNSIPSPIANYSISPTTCVGQPVQFTDQTQTNGGGSLQSWLWNFNDPLSGTSNTSILQNPTHSFTGLGPYNVTLTVTSANGCVNTYTGPPITIHALPVANFTNTDACEGNPTQFTNTSVSNSTGFISFAWSFGDGVTDTQENPQHTYLSFGSYSVTFTVVNDNGCVNTVTRTVIVNPKPVADFTFTAASCVGNPVNFTSQSYVPSGTSSYIQKWEWDFGDGSVTPPIIFPGNPNITHTFLGTAISHNVTLTVTTYNGCVSTITKTVTSVPSPIANFSSSPTTCLGQSVQFNDLTQTNGGGALAGWAWDFGDPLSGTYNSSTLQNPTHSFSGTGAFTVTLTVTSANGCVSTYSGPQININPLPVANFTYASACEQSPTTFTNTSVSNSTGFISYAWSFGDGGTSGAASPLHNYLTYGNYNVTLTVVNDSGCINSVVKPVIVNPKALPDFTFSAVTCLGNPVSYFDQSTVPSGFTSYIQTWQWDFGDGSTTAPINFPSNPDITHIFQGNATVHVVRLTVTTTAGCISFIEKTVTSVPAPVANFSYSSINCENQPVQFTDNSQTNGGGPIQTWNWNFGDPASGLSNNSTSQNPIHQFSSATGSPYTITLIVTNGNGCADTLLPKPQITINARPFSNFIADTVCQGTVTTFTSQATPSGSIGSYLWDFGDSQTGTSANPTHLYGTAGTYPVKLTVTSLQGCVKDTTKSVLVLGKPVPSFSYSSPNCAGDSVQFTDLSTTPHGSILNWTWDFDDGTIVGPIVFPNNQNVKHKFTNGGTYNVKLTINTTDGCTAEKITPVVIGFSPLANFSFATNACANTAVQFNDLSQLNGGPGLTSWLWNFGDPASGANNISTTQNPTHEFSSGAIFTVRLMVTNANGCIDSLAGGKQITVNAAPVASFTAATACMGSPTQFTDASTPPTPATIAAWAWNFGDPASGTNNTSTLQNPTHIYNAPGTYNVLLTVTNSNQCPKDTIIEVIVNPRPQAMFDYSAACVNDSTQFTDLSIAPGSQVSEWLWSFGCITGTCTSTIQNPKYAYTTPGTYQVKLVVTNLDGCKDSVTIAVVARPTPVAAFTSSAYYCPAGKVDFQDLSTAPSSAIAERLWTFEPGYTSNAPNPSHTFPVTNMNYAVSLIVTDTYGCMDTIVDSVFVKPGFVFSYSNDTVCQGLPTHFTPLNQTPGDSLYSVTWNFGDPASGPNNNSQLYNPSHIFTQPGTYIVKMKAYNTDNCVDSVFKEVRVYKTPEPLFSYISTPCDSTLHFSDSTIVNGSGWIANWTWRWGDGGSTVLNSPPIISGDTAHKYMTPGIYPVTLVMTSNHGCVDSITRNVQRFPCISTGFTYNDTLCARNKIAFTDNSLPVNLINQWTWSWDDGTPDTSYTVHNSPITHTFADSGTYHVKVKISALVDGTTISDSATSVVKVRPTPIPFFSNVPVCLNQKSLFRDTSKTFGVGVSKWAWTFGSKPTDTSTFKNPTHTYDTAGIYDVRLIVTNKYGCKDSLTKPNRIYGLPEAHYTNTIACVGDPTFFTDKSIVSDTTLSRWRWIFNYPVNLRDSSNLQDPDHRYPTDSTYTVRMIVRDHYGCLDTIDSTVKVNITPLSSFTATNGYNGKQGQVKLNNLTTGADTYKWDFGNGKTSTETDPVALFTEDGTYTIKLISLNEFNCTDTTYYTYELLFKGLYVPNAFSPSGTNLGVRLFQPVGVNLKQFHVTVFDLWGHMLWESTKLDDNGSPTEGWDGTYQGVLMPQGNYMWKISALFVDDSQWEGSDIGVGGSGKTMGTVALIR